MPTQKHIPEAFPLKCIQNTTRPQCHGRGIFVTTPATGRMIGLLGSGYTQEGVTLSKSEFRAIRKLYDVKPEDNEFTQAGTDRNVMRHAEFDGLRMVAWLAQYVEPGQDPLRTLVQLAVEAGIDVTPEDVDWACEG